MSHEHGELHGMGAPGHPDLGAEPSLPLPPEQERRLLQRPGVLRVLSSSFTLFKRGSYQLAPMLLQPEPQHGASALPASSGRQKHCLQLGVTPDTSALCADAESITPLRVWDTQAGPAPREYPPDGVYTTMKISYKNGTLQLESLRLEIRKSREVASALEQPSGGCRLPPMEPPAPGGWSRGRADLVLELGDAAQPQRPLWAPLSLCPSCERSMLPRQRLNNL